MTLAAMPALIHRVLPRCLSLAPALQDVTTAQHGVPALQTDGAPLAAAFRPMACLP